MESSAQKRVELIERIGKGSFGEVWIARHFEATSETGATGMKIVAVKIEHRSSPKTSLKKEYQAMKAIENHQNLIGLVEFVENYSLMSQGSLQGQSYLALEFAHNKTLLDYLMTKPGMVEEKWVRYWFKQIVAGLKHIRDHQHAHLDLKCDNILLDYHLNAKIADFGFSRINTQGIDMDLGSEFHRAPEICIEDFPYDGEKADVFALAIILYAMQMKSFPTDRRFNIIETLRYQEFTAGNLQSFWSKSPQPSVLFKDLFEGMFREDPSSRATLDQISTHDWLSGDEPSQDELNAEIARLNQIQSGLILSWTEQISDKHLYATPSQIFRDGKVGSIDVNKEFEILSNEDREATQYQKALFEWTHFKATAETEPCYILPIIVAIINIIKLDNAIFEANIKQDSKKFEAEFSQVKTAADDGGCSLVNGTVAIYTEESAEGGSTKWVIFNRTEGDPFLFRNLFESVVRHSQIKELLLKK